MWAEEKFTKSLRPDEQIVTIIRSSALIYSQQFAGASLVIIMAFFLLFPLFRLGNYGLIIFISLVIIGGFWLFRTWYLWTHNVFLLTDNRIIDYKQKGIFHKEVSEATFESIEDVSYTKKGISATLYNYGELRVQTAGQKPNLTIKAVKNPEALQNLITDWQNENLRTHEGKSNLI